MKKNTPALEETIRATAYLLSEQAGHPAGMEEFFWLQAEALVLRAPAETDGDGSPKGRHVKARVKKTAKRNPARLRGKKRTHDPVWH